MADRKSTFTFNDRIHLTTIALSANAGISVTFGDARVWVDALHAVPSGGPDGYSHVSHQMWDKMQNDSAFKDPDLICFTHCHEDHYAERMALYALDRFKNACLILPQPLSRVSRYPRTRILSGLEATFSCKDVDVQFIRLPHEGAQYSNTVMYGMVLSAYGRHIFIGSDCETASPLLADVLRNELKDLSIDIAVLPFPWLTLRKGRAFLEQNLQPHHLLLCHIPFEEDDINGYREAAHRALADFRRVHGEDHMDVRLLEFPMQTEIILL